MRFGTWNHRNFYISGLLKAVARKLAKCLRTLDLVESRRSDWEGRTA